MVSTPAPWSKRVSATFKRGSNMRRSYRSWLEVSPRKPSHGATVQIRALRTSTKYADRPAAADIAFCVAAFANGMTDDRIERALEDEYLSRDPSPSKRTAYIRRTMAKARDWAVR
jgi:hypothetical protein